MPEIRLNRNHGAAASLTEEALADYAQRFGLTDKARAALTFHLTFESRKLPN